eukprot:3014033-Pyramimonas_sp.AAC.1
MALASQVPYVFISQVPDKASSNVRALAFLHEKYSRAPNILESPLQCCSVHAVHTTMVHAVGEDCGGGE